MELTDYRNYIFDLGGVIIDIDMDIVRQGLIDLGIGRLRQFFYARKIEERIELYQTGRLTTQQFCQEVCEHCKPGTSPEMVRQVWNSVDLGTTPQRLQKLKDLRAAGHQVYLLSNINDMHWTHMAQHDFIDLGFPPQDCFHRIFLSHEMGLSKPSRQIFEEVIRQTGVDPTQTLFLDDTRENLASARSVGLSTFHVQRNTGNWLTEL